MACPCGRDASFDSYVKSYYFMQLFHTSCADVTDGGKLLLFACDDCKHLTETDSVTDQEKEVVSSPDGSRDSCPRGERFALEPLIKCRTYSQLFHEGCVGAPADDVQNFVCSDCIAARDLEDDLTARNAALREDTDQEEIFEKLRLPNISPEKSGIC